MTENNKEVAKTRVKEEAFLSKFEGDPLPENEFERMHIVDGKVVAVHKIKNGEIVSTEEF